MCDFYYLDLSLELDQDASQISVVFFKKNVLNSLTQLFGDISSSVNVDLLKYDPSRHRAIIRVSSDYYVKLRAALTLCSSYEDIKCSYKINNASPSLLSLTGSSREYVH
uniref:Putative ribonuclease p protein subunit p14-like isoform x3 n=1 Tax=Xenopsylla cheopis TaxID=163159 RepID=A0A6M2DTM9_XENCH